MRHDAVRPVGGHLEFSPSGGTRRVQPGFSLLEVVISSLLLTVLVFLVTTFALNGSRAQAFAERLARVIEVDQELVAAIQEELHSSVRLFSNDALGNAYLALLTGSTLPPNESHVLPTTETNGIFEPETTTASRTGNQLLFAQYAWTSRVEVTSGATYEVDVYRLVHYYLTREGGGPSPEHGIGINMAKFVSEPLVAGDQVDAIDDPLDRIEVLQHFHDGTPDSSGIARTPTNVVWLLGADPAAAGTLRQITPAGTLEESSSTPRSNGSWQIVADATRSRAGLLYFRHHSVATNHALASARVGRLSVRDDQAGVMGFPHGFEIQQIGPSSARKVLVRLVLTTTNNNGRRPHYTMQLITDCRDL